MSTRKNTKAKEINFYLKYSYDPVAAAKKRRLRNMIVPPAAAILVFVIAFAVIMIPAFVKNSKAAEYEDYATNPTNIQRYEDAKSVIEERNGQQEIYTELSDLRASIAAMPTPGSSFMATMRACISGASATGYSFEAGSKMFVINLKTSNVTNLPSVVSNLRRTGEFADVKYGGYQGNQGEYTTTITCIYK